MKVAIFFLFAQCSLPENLLAWTLQANSKILWRSPSGYSADQTAATKAAAELASDLGQMTSGTYTVVSGSNAAPQDILLEIQPPADPTTVDVRGAELEQYRISTTNGYLHITGPTGVAVRQGVAAFLRDQGCRWLMPSPKWWILPHRSVVSYDGTTESQAAFAYRRIWYGYGTGWFQDGETWYETWHANNLLDSSAAFNTGHSYDNIIGRNEATFAEHPEYYAIDENGVSHATWPQESRKFHYANEGLRELCATDRQNLLGELRSTNPYQFMVSMDPSDGAATDYNADSVALGTPTDRVFSLSNYVATHLREASSNAAVGMYAYGSHRLPPTIDLESNIHVAVAMAFNQTDLSYPELIEQWGAAAGSLGIREYYGVEEWDWGLPGLRGGLVSYHKEMIPFFFENGAVSLSAETNANWGAQALGLYVASRLLWDPDADVDPIVDDFLTSAYGAAAPVMKQLYDLYETQPSLSPGLVNNMYNIAFSALDAVGADEACKARIVDMIAYINYVDIYRVYSNTPEGEPKWSALFDLMNYANRIETRNVVHTYALARQLCNGAVITARPEFYMFRQPDPPIWKVGDQYTDSEILSIAGERQAVVAGELTERTTYSRDLVLVQGDTNVSTLPYTVKFRYNQSLYLKPVTSGSYSFAFTAPANHPIEGSLIRQRDSVEVMNFTASDSTSGTMEVFPLDAKELYRLDVAIGATSGTMVVPDGLAAALEATEEQPLFLDYCGGYVFVPQGTQEIRCSGDPRLSIKSPSGVRTDITPATSGTDGFTRLPVPAGQDNAMWTVFNQTRGNVAFLNIPQLVNLNRAYLLLPREVLPLVATPGDTTIETLPGVTKFRGALSITIVPVATGTYSFTFSPAAQQIVSGKIVRQSDNVQITTFSYDTSGSVCAVQLDQNKRYLMEVSTGSNSSTSLTVPAGLAAAVDASETAKPFFDYCGGYLYVPSQTNEIDCAGTPRLSLKSPSGIRTDVLPTTNGSDGVTHVPVAPGDDDRIWTVYNQTRGNIFFRNVPPYVNLNRAHLALPGSPFAGN